MRSRMKGPVVCTVAALLLAGGGMVAAPQSQPAPAATAPPLAATPGPARPPLVELLYQAARARTDDEVAKMSYQNAMRIFQFDPFARRPKDQCTVAALRALGTD